MATMQAVLSTGRLVLGPRNFGRTVGGAFDPPGGSAEQSRGGGAGRPHDELADVHRGEVVQAESCRRESPIFDGPREHTPTATVYRALMPTVSLRFADQS